MKKSKIIIIIAASVLIVAAVITALIFIFKDNYKPDEETLNVVNEASVTVFNSEITGKYKQTDTQKIGEDTLYVFEFKLKNGDTAIFAFDKDLKQNKDIYWKDEDGSFKLVIFVSFDDGDRDNEASWPKGWK